MHFYYSWDWILEAVPELWFQPSLPVVITPEEGPAMAESSGRASNTQSQLLYNCMLFHFIVLTYLNIDCSGWLHALNPFVIFLKNKFNKVYEAEP